MQTCMDLHVHVQVIKLFKNFQNCMSLQGSAIWKDFQISTSSENPEMLSRTFTQLHEKIAHSTCTNLHCSAN